MIGLRLTVFAVFGLAFGSFCTVLVHRLPRREPVAVSRSRCPGCGTEIRASDNIPVLSYLLLRGRCRACQVHISAEYPVVEAIVAALFVVAGARFRDPWVGGLVAPFLGVLFAAALIDLRHRIIPNRLVLPALAVFAAAVAALDVAGGHVAATTGLFGMLAFGGGLLVVALVSPGGMGMGDVKLAALIGLVLGALGWSYVGVAVMGAVLLGGLGAVGALALGRGRKDTIPFGPYLAAGALVSALLAPQLSARYLALLT